MHQKVLVQESLEFNQAEKLSSKLKKVCFSHIKRHLGSRYSCHNFATRAWNDYKFEFFFYHLPVVSHYKSGMEKVLRSKISRSTDIWLLVIQVDNVKNERKTFRSTSMSYYAVDFLIKINFCRPKCLTFVSTLILSTLISLPEWKRDH